MKSFEKELRKRILILIVYGTISGLILITAFIISLYGNSEFYLSPENLIGFLIAIGIVILFRIRIYKNALKSSETLETLYVKEIDERNRLISMKTCKSCIYLALGLLGFSGIIASFINQTVFLTIGTILILFLVLYGILLLYYSKKL